MKMSRVRNFVTVEEGVISKEFIRHMWFEFLLESNNFSSEFHGIFSRFSKIYLQPFSFYSFFIFSSNTFFRYFSLSIELQKTELGR